LVTQADMVFDLSPDDRLLGIAPVAPLGDLGLNLLNPPVHQIGATPGTAVQSNFCSVHDFVQAYARNGVAGMVKSHYVHAVAHPF
jgi:hypothetical protein